MNDDGVPYIIPEGTLKPFSFIIVNSAYVPNELPHGGTDDGNWIFGKPVTGAHILKFFEDLNKKAKALSYPTEVIKQIEAEVKQ